MTTTVLPPWLIEHCFRLQTKDPDLKNLNLNIRRLDKDMMEALAKALLIHDTIEIVNMTSSLVRPEQALLPLARIVLPNHPSLQKIHLSYNRLESVAALGMALETNDHLLELYLDYNQIDTISAMALAHGLTHNNTLKVLQLNFNKMGDEGGKALANSLKTNNSLTQLGMNKNQLGLESAGALTEALEQNVTLTRLDLFENPDMPPAVIEKLQLHIRANKKGRYVLREPLFPASWWSFVLEGIDPDMTFFFLKQKPELLARSEEYFATESAMKIE
jgi:Ran GTPase-activating protein (RanGAP) involved in mRNA processing and transport